MKHLLDASIAVKWVLPIAATIVAKRRFKARLRFNDRSH